jgi:hypothetical protein
MKGVFFPHGDIPYREDEVAGNLWRETSFALFLIKQAVNPRMSIAECITNWDEISKTLAEPTRKRKFALKRMNLIS